MQVTVIAGGVGAARFLAGLVRVVEPASITAIVNVGDDVELHGLHVSPDLDTVTYTLADAVNPDTGWGLAGESWQAMAMVAHYGGPDWFRLGDRDLGTHLFRTGRLREGDPLSVVTARMAEAWDLGLRLLPATDDRLRTMVTLAANGDEIDFQSYFVGRHHDVAVAAVRFDGAESARPAPGVLEAIADAATVVAPSNPIVSIGPVLAVPGVTEAIAARRDRVVAISPIVAGAALKGPADRMLVELGHEASVVGVARLYRDWCSTLVVDHADAASAEAVAAEGMRCVVTDTIMRDPEVAAGLARDVLGGGRGVTAGGLTVFPILGVPEVAPGDDLAGQIAEAAAAGDGTALLDGDVVVVTQKVVSKAEGKLERVDPDDPRGHKAIVERESVRVLRRRGDLIISETRHGFICANAGVDLSNVEDGWAALLPDDPDRSARRLRDGIKARAGVDVAIIVSDTFGRVWRRGLTDVAIGCAGIAAVVDLRGTTDALGRELQVTEVAVVDELAGAADLVMGKALGVAAAVIRGVDPSWLRPGEVRAELVRPPQEDLFR